jgi:xanthine dehydrogenase YagT iron-sulfur-binding subunit
MTEGITEVSFVVNGKPERLRVERRAMLIDTLRDRLFLTGAKKGCGEGVCGACTVLLNGKAICSCLMFTTEARGSEIMTIEGLSEGPDQVDALQRAFMERDALQCGYCTPGQIMAAKSFLGNLRESASSVSDVQIKEALEGNLCRCGAYNSIVQAIKEVAAGITG